MTTTKDYLEFSALLMEHEKIVNVTSSKISTQQQQQHQKLQDPTRSKNNMKMKVKVINCEVQVWLLRNEIIRSAFVIPFRDIEYLTHSDLFITLVYWKANNSFRLIFLTGKASHRDDFLDQVMPFDENGPTCSLGDLSMEDFSLADDDDDEDDLLVGDETYSNSSYPSRSMSRISNSSSSSSSSSQSHRTMSTQTIHRVEDHGMPQCERPQDVQKPSDGRKYKVEIVYDLDKNFQRFRYERVMNQLHQLEHRRTLVHLH